MEDEIWVDIPVDLEDAILILKNGKEHISIDLDSKADKVYGSLPVFETFFEFDAKLNKGYWYDPSRGDDYIVPVSFRKSDDIASKNINSKWSLIFGKEESSYEGVLILESDAQGVSGTILTETGDYRYLHGSMRGDSLRLQTFDGSHLFLFTAIVSEDSLKNGVFYSGNHYKDEWNGIRNPKADLRASNEILKANGSDLSFEVLNENNQTLSFDSSSFTAKLSILQIMGTWCPNCMDESRVLKELYDKHKDSGLDIMGVAFERHGEAQRAWKAINKAKKDMEITYPVYFGGKADKKIAAEKFSFLDEVFSFPTTVFIDASGDIVAVHSGFNGPATGKAYKKELALLDDIISEHLN